jgi:hypothetical protein
MVYGAPDFAGSRVRIRNGAEHSEEAPLSIAASAAPPW